MDLSKNLENVKKNLKLRLISTKKYSMLFKDMINSFEEIKELQETPKKFMIRLRILESYCLHQLTKVRVKSFISKDLIVFSEKFNP